MLRSLIWTKCTIISIFKEKNIRTSIFIDPLIKMVEGARLCGADRVELYTEEYAIKYHLSKEEAVKKYTYLLNKKEAQY